MKAVCVYCGSSPGTRSDYAAAATLLGRELARRDLTLVYGGAAKGLMGCLADSVKAAGGRVVGVIPQSLLDKEISHDGLDELHVVDSMHARKALMAELADGFIALPGGFGTLEEIIETLTWAQLGFHVKPCGLLNVAHYYDALLAFVQTAVEQGFVRQEHHDMLIVEAQPAAMLARFGDYQPLLLDKWQA